MSPGDRTPMACVISIKISWIGNLLATRFIVNMFLPNFNICCGCSKEPSHWDGSFEYPQHMFWLRRTIFWYALLTKVLILLNFFMCIKIRVIYHARMCLKANDWWHFNISCMLNSASSRKNTFYFSAFTFDRDEHETVLNGLWTCLWNQLKVKSLCCS